MFNGIWFLNEELTFDEDIDITVNMTFISEKETIYRMYSSLHFIKNYDTIEMYYDDELVYQNNEQPYFLNELDMHICIIEPPADENDEVLIFLDQFLANNARYKESDIFGNWLFNEKLNITFDSNWIINSDKGSIILKNGEMYYVTTETVKVYDKNTGWRDRNDRLINIISSGETFGLVQIMEFLNENAVRDGVLPEPDFYPTQKDLSITFNDTISISGDLTISSAFSTDITNVSHSTITFNKSSGTIQYDNTIVYSTQTGWIDENDRHITFDSIKGDDVKYIEPMTNMCWITLGGVKTSC